VLPGFVGSSKSACPQRSLATHPAQLPPRHHTRTQFTGKVDPKTFEFGQNKSLLHGTFGLPNGYNAQPPQQFLRSYEKAPVLPERGWLGVPGACKLR